MVDPKAAMMAVYLVEMMAAGMAAVTVALKDGMMVALKAVIAEMSLVADWVVNKVACLG